MSTSRSSSSSKSRSLPVTAKHSVSAAASPTSSAHGTPVKEPRGGASAAKRSFDDAAATTKKVPLAAAGVVVRPRVDLDAYRRNARREHSGDGTNAAPYDLPLAEEPNDAGCYHCPLRHCDCRAFEDLLLDTIDEVRVARVTEVAGKNHLCAKSILAPFVTRLAAELDITRHDTFYDLGSGNGSVLFQVAFMTGARCVGVELSAHNADLSRQLWARLRPKLEALRQEPMPEVTIITGDLADVINADDFGKSSRTVVWTANLLMPRAVTHYMSERFRELPAGCRLMCLDDLYPHGRSVCQMRDPEAFELFEMTDYVWPPLSVEWMSGGGGRFYRHVRV
jgi:SAM-dependent methyltransferase